MGLKIHYKYSHPTSAEAGLATKGKKILKAVNEINFLPEELLPEIKKVFTVAL